MHELDVMLERARSHVGGDVGDSSSNHRPRPCVIADSRCFRRYVSKGIVVLSSRTSCVVWYLGILVRASGVECHQPDTGAHSSKRCIDCIHVSKNSRRAYIVYAVAKDGSGDSWSRVGRIRT